VRSGASAATPTADLAVGVAYRKGRIRRLGATLGESLFILPLVALLAVFVAGPALVAVFRSFFEWRPGGNSTFVGLDNYVQLFQSPVFQQILRNEAFFLIGVPIWTFLPLILALLLYERVPAAGVLRTIFFFPSLLSPAIVALMFAAVLSPEGLINSFLRAVNLGFVAHDWVDSPDLVRPTLIAVFAWSTLGTPLIIYAAALSAVRTELLEAAELDGASWWQRLRHVVVPSIKPVIGFVAFLQLLHVFLGFFDWIYVLTRGGPGYLSTTIDYDIYLNSFGYGEFGLAAAESVCLLAIIGAIVTSAIVWRRCSGAGRA
jgi:multiple sugar transport system permease protein